VGVVLDRDEFTSLEGRNPALGVRQQGKRTAVTHTPWTFGSATLSVLHKELHNYRKLDFLQVEQGGKVASEFLRLCRAL
jgi:hypothetical protein